MKHPISLILFSGLAFASMTTFAQETLFEASRDCRKSAGLHVVCQSKSQSVEGTLKGTEWQLPVLNQVPVNWSLGYRFYCDRVTGFGDLVAKVKIGDRPEFNLKYQDIPTYQKFETLLDKDDTISITVETTKSSTRLGESCGFEILSSSFFPATSILGELSKLVNESKGTVEFLNSITLQSKESEKFSLAFGFLSSKKSAWSTAIATADRTIKKLEAALERLPEGNDKIPTFVKKIAEFKKQKEIYQKELTDVDLFFEKLTALDDTCPADTSGCIDVATAIKDFAADLDQRRLLYLSEIKSYLDTATGDTNEESIESIIVDCSLNQTESCGE